MLASRKPHESLKKAWRKVTSLGLAQVQREGRTLARPKSFGIVNRGGWYEKARRQPTWGEAIDLHDRTSRERLWLLEILLQLPLAWADLLGALCGLSGVNSIDRPLACLRRRGLVDFLSPAVWSGRSPRLYHLTDLGLGVLSLHYDEDPLTLARRHGARWVDLLAMMPGIEWVADAYEILRAIVRGREHGLVGLEWRRPWYARYRSPWSATLAYVQMPAWVRLTWESEYLECFLLPDWATFPPDVFRARLFRLAAYSRLAWGWKARPLILVAPSPERLEAWRGLLDYVSRTSGVRLPAYLTTWKRMREELPRLPAVAKPTPPGQEVADPDE